MADIMADILERIVAVKRREVERLKVEAPISALEGRISEQAAPLNLAGALWGDSARIIAEAKKASPSKGVLRADYDAGRLAELYADSADRRQVVYAALKMIRVSQDGYGGRPVVCVQLRQPPGVIIRP